MLTENCYQISVPVEEFLKPSKVLPLTAASNNFLFCIKQFTKKMFNLDAGIDLFIFAVQQIDTHETVPGQK